MTARQNVRSFPMARLKFAKRLRTIADGLAARGDQDGGDVFIVHVDPHGQIHTDFLLATQRDRVLRLTGLLEVAKYQLVEMMSQHDCEDD